MGIDGLYFDGGKKMGLVPDSVAVVRDDDDVQQPGIAKVATAYQKDHHRKLKQCKVQKQDEEEYDDAESKKKAEAILEKSTGHEQLQFKQLFDFFDVDKDRTWGTVEFAQRMTDIGCDTSVEASANLLYFAGVHDVDRITYEDFIQMMPKLNAFRRLVEKEALKYFAEKDVEAEGWLSPEALREVIFEIAGTESLGEHQVRHLITYDFFIRALFGTPPVLTYVPKAKRQGAMASLMSNFSNFSKAFSNNSSASRRG